MQAHDNQPATCCAADLVFVRCPIGNVVTEGASSYCNMSAAEIALLEKTCCSAGDVCPSDGLCCIDPGPDPLAGSTPSAAGCNSDGHCQTDPGDSAIYTPPVKK